MWLFKLSSRILVPVLCLQWKRMLFLARAMQRVSSPFLNTSSSTSLTMSTPTGGAVLSRRQPEAPSVHSWLLKSRTIASFSNQPSTLAPSCRAHQKISTRRSRVLASQTSASRVITITETRYITVEPIPKASESAMARPSTIKNVHGPSRSTSACGALSNATFDVSDSFVNLDRPPLMWSSGTFANSSCV